jgi:integrase
MAKRRGRGEGSIFKRKDGTWQGAITFGKTKSGTQRRETVYGETQGEVRKKLDALKLQVNLGTVSPKDLTVKGFLEEWLNVKARQVKPRTIESYRYTVEKYINSHLGQFKLHKLNPTEIEYFLGEIVSEVSPHTSNYCRSVLLMAFEQAVKWRLLASNPADGTKPVRETKREIDPWKPSEVQCFIDYACGHRLYPLFYLAITSGLRFGELLGLRWEDLQGNTLRVRNNLTKENGQWVLSTPKTSKSVRYVALAEDTLAVLATHRAAQAKEIAYLGEAWEHPNHMFVTEVGTFLDQRNVLRVWHRLQEAAGVPRIRFHDARHLHVSLLIRQGLDVKTIAERLAHTDPRFTLKKYAHLFEDQRQRAALLLSQLLAPIEAEQNSQGG